MDKNESKKENKKEEKKEDKKEDKKENKNEDIKETKNAGSELLIQETSLSKDTITFDDEASKS